MSPIDNDVRVTTAVGDMGTAIAAVESRGTEEEACRDGQGFAETDHLPCGNATSFQQVGTASAFLLLPDGSVIPLVEVARAPAATVATVDRTVDPSSTFCGLEGCVAATIDRSLGAVRIGGGGSGWLAEVAGLSDSAYAAAGEGAAPPTATTAGTVQHLDAGVGTINLADPGPTTFSPSRTFSAGASGQYSVTMTGNFTARGASIEDPAAADAGCSLSCRRTSAAATSGSPLRGTFTVRVTSIAADDTVVVNADLVVAIDLGRARAQTNYEQAPDVL
jgi:hypothetical protein